MAIKLKRPSCSERANFLIPSSDGSPRPYGGELKDIANVERDAKLEGKNMDYDPRSQQQQH
jgi:hypothetical protein